MLRQDYIKRLIEQLASFVAKVAGLVKQGLFDEAQSELQEAERALALPLGTDRLDARSVSILLGGGDKVVLLAALLEQRAQIAAARSEPASAAALRQRARELLDLAQPSELASEAESLRARLSA